MSKQTKNIKKVSKLVEKNKLYPLNEAIDLAKSTSYSKFDGSIDLAVKLNLDTTKVEQQLRGSISLPNGNGKSISILAIDDSVSVDELKKSGADFAGDASIIQDIEKMISKIDLIITTPKIMPQLAKLGKVLGPRGLMPNPKTGTVTTTITKTIEEFKKGRTEYRTDSYGNIHISVGKVSFKTDKIAENINAVIALLKSKKPSTVKGTYIQNIAVSPTMGKGVKVLNNF